MINTSIESAKCNLNWVTDGVTEYAEKFMKCKSAVKAVKLNLRQYVRIADNVSPLTCQVPTC